MKFKSCIFVWLAILAMAGIIGMVPMSGNPISQEVLLSFAFLVSAYVGSSQLAGAIKTKSLPEGERFSGNRKKLILITSAIFILVIESAIVGKMAGIQTPTSGLLSIFMACSALLVSGEKAKTALEGNDIKNEDEIAT